MTLDDIDQDPLPFDEQCERNFIGGEWKFTREGYEFDIYDPADSTVIAAIPLSTHRDIKEMVEAAERGLADWRQVPMADRVAILQKTLSLIEESIDLVASIIMRDTGLPIAHAKNDTLDAVREVRESLASVALERGDVPGLIGQILSWSNPLVVCMRVLSVDLARGNVAIVHPSIRAPLSLVFLADALSRAGAAGGVFNLVQGAGTDAGMALAAHPKLKRLDFQGSRATAHMVSLSPKRHGLPVQPFLRFVRTIELDQTSDLDASADEIATCCFCHAARPGFGGLEVKLPLEMLPAFSEKMKARFTKATYFDGQHGSHSVAPYLAEKFRIEGEDAVERYLNAGAELICSSPEPDEKTFRMGWFTQARVIHDLSGAIALDPEAPNGPLVLVHTH